MEKQADRRRTLLQGGKRKIGNIRREEREQGGTGVLKTHLWAITWARKRQSLHLNPAEPLAEFRQKRFIKMHFKFKS